MVNYQRITATFTGVSNDWVEVQLTNQPRRFIIKRLRAEIVDSDSWAEQIAVCIGEQAQVSGTSLVQDPELGYTPTVISNDLATSPIDSDLDTYFESLEPSTTNSERGSVYVAIRLDTDPIDGQHTAGATAVVVLDIDVLG